MLHAYVLMSIRVRWKRLFQMFYLFSRRMLQVFYLDVAYDFTHMLQVFYPDVAYVCNSFQVFLGVSQVFQTYVACV
jgi:hypothetical protein